MANCASDWTWTDPAFPGSACRELDFSLIFSSVVLSILPSTIFYLAAVHHIYKLMQREISISKCKASKLLCAAKSACALLALLGNIMSLIGWMATQREEHGTGTTAVALSLPVSVSPPLCYQP